MRISLRAASESRKLFAAAAASRRPKTLATSAEIVYFQMCAFFKCFYFYQCTLFDGLRCMCYKEILLHYYASKPDTCLSNGDNHST